MSSTGLKDASLHVPALPILLSFTKPLVCSTQVHAAADLAQKPAESVLAGFDFEQYMLKRGKMINQALDKALPMAYPPDVIESMRCVHVSHCCWPSTQCISTAILDHLQDLSLEMLCWTRSVYSRMR